MTPELELEDQDTVQVICDATLMSMLASVLTDAEIRAYVAIYHKQPS